MTIGMIWAQDRHGTIGDGTGMLWHVPDDFAYFKATTLGHPIVMGRSSWESLGGRPLPGRRNIVLTRSAGYEARGADVAGSLDDALARAEGSDGGDLVWITGGGHVYAAAMDRADLLHVSELDLDVTAGAESLVAAPRIDPALWEVDEQESDDDWRPRSGDARWRVRVYRRRAARQSDDR